MCDPTNVKDYVHVDQGGNRQSDKLLPSGWIDAPDFLRLGHYEMGMAKSSLWCEPRPMKPEDVGINPEDSGYDFIASRDSCVYHAMKHLEAASAFLMLADRPNEYMGDEEYKIYKRQLKDKANRWKE